jgi:hypothetical protein
LRRRGAQCLILFDEILNFLNRHRELAESFYAFVQNLTVAMTGARGSACVISLPRSQVEMSESDLAWQERVTKVVKRVAKDLLVNDEAEIGDVVRRRLFDDLGKESIRRAAALTYANWCFDHRAELLPEVTAVDRAITETGAREFLRARFEQCYPFHPSTLTVFQRKCRSLSQFQQTLGTLAMFAQWVSIAFSKDHKEARREALITLGSAPLHVREFRSVVLGQLGEIRLDPALDSDVAGAQNKAATLDADVTKGPLKDLHRRVGTTILFESSGGQNDQIAHVPSYASRSANQRSTRPRSTTPRQLWKASHSTFARPQQTAIGSGSSRNSRRLYTIGVPHSTTRKSRRRWKSWSRGSFVLARPSTCSNRFRRTVQMSQTFPS